MFKPEEKVLVKRALQRVWNAIASDVAGYVEDNEEAVRMAIDCDRLLRYGGPDGSFAHELVGRAALANGYQALVDELTDMVPLL
jgi:hypothetical protein